MAGTCDASGARRDPLAPQDAAGAAARELVDVIDDDDRVLRQVTRAEVRAGNLLHRSVFVAVVTSAGELVVHQRAGWKDVWPSRWDVCFGGVVDAGESFATAAVRELSEEAGITCSPAELVDLGVGRYQDGQVREIGHVYQLVTDATPCFDDGEVVADERIPLDRIDVWLAAREVCPDSEALVVPRLRWPVADDRDEGVAGA